MKTPSFIKTYIQSENPIDILALAREHVNWDAIDEDPDWAYNAAQGNIPNVNIIMLQDLEELHISTLANPQSKSLAPADSEPDIVYITYTVPHDEDLNIDKVWASINQMLIFDCTDCCNAIQQLTLCKNGVYCFAITSANYHS